MLGLLAMAFRKAKSWKNENKMVKLEHATEPNAGNLEENYNISGDEIINGYLRYEAIRQKKE